ncbi:unnamed protein product [Leptosia nina]|uniref:Uncharacterized protein n=1 Tax=Leptosia nina TaxID=320188 RepID=A0AAV1K1Z7_9NEOP
MKRTSCKRVSGSSSAGRASGRRDPLSHSSARGGCPVRNPSIRAGRCLCINNTQWRLQNVGHVRGRCVPGARGTPPPTGSALEVGAALGVCAERTAGAAIGAASAAAGATGAARGAGAGGAAGSGTGSASLRRSRGSRWERGSGKDGMVASWHGLLGSRAGGEGDSGRGRRRGVDRAMLPQE